jgi:hypothetical protein
MKEFIVKENEDFKLKVSSKECQSPKGLYSLDFINETLKDGEVFNTSTYNFFMTKDEIQTLIKGLENV